MSVRIAIFLTLVMTVLPVWAFELFLDEVAGVASTRLYQEILGKQLLAPVLLLLLEGLVVYCAYAGKRVSCWLVIIGWIGVAGVIWGSGEEAHNFSHVLFDKCTGYGEFNLMLALSTGVLITSTWLLDYRVVRGSYLMPRFGKPRMSPFMWRVLVWLSILGCWVSTLLYFDIL